MRLNKLFPTLKLERAWGRLEVRGISDDSRLTQPGDHFFVRRRPNFDIFSVLGQIEGRAQALVASAGDKQRVSSLVRRRPIIFVKDIEPCFAACVDRFYAFKKSDFKFIGVTGTNGKTTTTHLIYHLLNRLGEPAALIGTVKHLMGRRGYKSSYTTPDYLALRRLFARFKQGGAHFVVMEVSSHALTQQRLRGIDFARCVFTNLSRDHLDYHKEMTSYFRAKERFFLTNPKALAIINKDDPWASRLLKKLPRRLSYGFAARAELAAENIVLTRRGSRFDLSLRGQSVKVRTALLGRHNISNILAAVGVVSSFKFPLRDIARFIPGLRAPAGRLEKVASHIFVDYAHTPDALRQVLLTLRQCGYLKIICVFGCGGNRDKGKRKTMGRVASGCADFTFITSDNPRHEDARTIIAAIAKGFSRNNYSVVPNRRQAIKRAIKLKSKYKDCCLLVAGKGHEDYQIVGDKKIPFSDKKVIKEIILV